MVNRLPRELRRLDDIARSLAETTSLKEIKTLRDKAEAARHYAKSAALGLKIQNHVAEIKLRAERRAGELLSELAPHGGNRKSSSHDGNLKLSELGINPNQSARWRREAAISDTVFEQYVHEANARGRDITAQGLLRLERLLAGQRENSHASQRQSPTFSESTGNEINRSRRSKNGRDHREEPPAKSPELPSVQELFDELKNHRNLLEKILTPWCNGKASTLSSPEKRLMLRLLLDFSDLIGGLEKCWLRSNGTQ